MHINHKALKDYGLPVGSTADGSVNFYAFSGGEYLVLANNKVITRLEDNANGLESAFWPYDPSITDIRYIVVDGKVKLIDYKLLVKQFAAQNPCGEGYRDSVIVRKWFCVGVDQLYEFEVDARKVATETGKPVTVVDMFGVYSKQADGSHVHVHSFHTADEAAAKLFELAEIDFKTNSKAPTVYSSLEEAESSLETA